jgi:hypothetical protein
VLHLIVRNNNKATNLPQKVIIQLQDHTPHTTRNLLCFTSKIILNN